MAHIRDPERLRAPRSAFHYVRMGGIIRDRAETALRREEVVAFGHPADSVLVEIGDRIGLCVLGQNRRRGAGNAEGCDRKPVSVHDDLPRNTKRSVEGYAFPLTASASP